MPALTRVIASTDKTVKCIEGQNGEHTEEERDSGWTGKTKDRICNCMNQKPTINKVFYVPPCALGEVREINTMELLESKAPKTANLSVNLLLTSPGWADRVCSEFSRAETRLGSKPLYPCEMKQDRRKVPGASYKELRVAKYSWNQNGKKKRNCATDSDCVILVFSYCKDPKWETVGGCRRKGVDHSSRGTRAQVFIFFCIFLLVSQLRQG